MKGRIPCIVTLLATALLLTFAAAGFSWPAAAQSAEVEPVYIIPYLIPPDANGVRTVTVAAGQHIILGARWGACTTGLASAFIPGAAIYYEIDGVPLPSSSIRNRRLWAQPVPQPSGQESACVMQTDTSWWVFWRYDYGTLPAGSHSGYFHYLHERPIPDGGDYDQDGHPDRVTVDREVWFAIVVPE